MTVKEFIEVLANAEDNSVIKLERSERFDVYQDDAITVEGYHFSNTASLEENPKGTRPTFIYLKDKKNIVIDGNGSEMIVHGIMTPFIFDSCENITLQNFTIDYAHPTMSEFTIEEDLGDGNYILKIAKDTLFEIEDNVLYWHGEKGKDGEYYWRYHYRAPYMISMMRDPETECVYMMMYPDIVRFPSIPEFDNYELLDEKRLKVHVKHPDVKLPLGFTVQTRCHIREQIGGAFYLCKDVFCRNLRVKAMHGLGILSQVCENVTFDGLDMTPGEGRTVCSNADFFQVACCKGKVLIQNCRCIGAHDDFVNVHGIHHRIIDINGNTVTVRCMQPNCRGFEMYFAGDAVEFINGKTLIPYGRANVLSVEHINDTDFVLELDDVADLKVDDVLENDTLTPELVVRNNYFGPSAGRGVLCTTKRPVLIENNVFCKNSGNTLCIEDDCNFWYESGYTTNVVFRNNEVICCNYNNMPHGAMATVSINPQVIDKTKDVYVHKYIEVSNNKITAAPGDPIYLDVKYTDKFVFKDNITDKPVEVRSVSTREIVLDGSDAYIKFS